MEHQETTTVLFFSFGTFVVIGVGAFGVVVVAFRSMLKGAKFEIIELKGKLDELTARAMDFALGKKKRDIKPEYGELFRAMRGATVLEELHEICFDLGIDHESFDATRRDPFARELINYCVDNSMMKDLMQLLRENSPAVEWPEVV